MNLEPKSLKHLTEQGYIAGNVNSYVTTSTDWTGAKGGFKGGFRKDAFGFMDLLAFRSDLIGSLAVQVTSKQQISKHLRDYRRDPQKRAAIIAWLLASNRFVIHGWYQEEVPTKSSKAKNATMPRWRLKRHEVSLADLELKPSDKKAASC